MTLLLLAVALLGQNRSCLNQTYRVQAARAPAYTTYQSYAQPYQQTYQIQERLIWVPVEGGNYSENYSAADLVGSRQRSQQQAGARIAYQQAVVDQLAGIRAELAAIKQAAGTGVDPGPPTGPPVVPPTQPLGQPPPNPDPNAPPPAPKPEIDPATAAQWTNDAIAVMQAKCLKCHNETKAEKGFVIFGNDGKLKLQSPLSLSLIKGKVDTLKMPPAKPLSEEEVAKIGLWVGLHDDEIADFVRGLLKTQLPAAAPPPPVVPADPRQGVIRQ